MAKIAFIGLGNMGGPMAANLVKGQHQVTAFDLSAAALDIAVEKGAAKAASAAEAVKGAEVVVTMLPAGKHVRGVYEKRRVAQRCQGRAADRLLDHRRRQRRAMSASWRPRPGWRWSMRRSRAASAAPTAGTLTFMVGGSDGAFAKAQPILEKMGKNIVHTGPTGAGQAAKICNNMILGITMIGVAEGFLLGKRLGLDVQKLFNIVSTSSGSCWAVNNYLPLPGPVPTSPANRDYQAGFTADDMLKDLKLAQQAAQTSGASTPMGAEAAQLFNMFVNAGGGAKDFSGIIKMLEGK